MKNILVTGSNGFIGAAMVKHLKEQGHNVYDKNRETLDLLSELKVDEFFWSNEIDIVIHAAACGGRRNKQDTAKDMYDNILMFEHLAKHADKYKLLISFGSGAEFDLRYDIRELKEIETEYRVPSDFYGLSKKIISQRTKNYDNMVNLRIFNCFGPTEAKDRMVKASFENCFKKRPIIIHQNKKMDFFYIGDLCKVVDLYIAHNDLKALPKDVNMCYTGKVALLGIAMRINKLTGNSSSVIIQEAGYSRPYCGDGSLLYGLFGNELDGLDEGLKKTYEELLNGRQATANT